MRPFGQVPDSTTETVITVTIPERLTSASDQPMAPQGHPKPLAGDPDLSVWAGGGHPAPPKPWVHTTARPHGLISVPHHHAGAHTTASSFVLLVCSVLPGTMAGLSLDPSMPILRQELPGPICPPISGL